MLDESATRLLREASATSKRYSVEGNGGNSKKIRRDIEAGLEPKTLDGVAKMLDKVAWSGHSARKSQVASTAFVEHGTGTLTFGLSRNLTKKKESNGGWAISVDTKKRPNLCRLVLKMVRTKISMMTFTTIHVTKNIRTEMHVDTNNVGTIALMTYGDFQGGELWTLKKK